jgi:hypothetical protein
MKHLQTYPHSVGLSYRQYQQLNESINSNALETILNKFSKGVDSKKLSSLVISNKNFFMPYFKKYVKDGVVMSDMIYQDLSKLNFSANESWYDEDYADKEDNNPVLRFLYKLFVRWPKNLVMGIWNLFKEMVIDEWRFDKTMSIFASLLFIVSSILIFFLGYLAYAFVEHEVSGLKTGEVQSEEFVPGHFEMRVHTIIAGKVPMTYTTNDWVPNAWYVEVVGKNGRKELWYTYNSTIGRSVKKGQEITNDDNWTWGETEKK